MLIARSDDDSSHHVPAADSLSMLNAANDSSVVVLATRHDWVFPNGVKYFADYRAEEPHELGGI
jgi:hypothetical protein